jgi:hypothetical protein
MSDKMELWTLTYASYDGKHVGAGSDAYFTEGAAIEALRQDVLDEAIDDLENEDWADDKEFENAADETRAHIAKLTVADLVKAYQDHYDDHVRTVELQHHDLTRPAPVPTTPEEIEAFLNDQPPAPAEERLAVGSYVRTTVYGHRGRISKMHDACPEDATWLAEQRAPEMREHANGPWVSILVHEGGSVCMPVPLVEAVEPFEFSNRSAHNYFPES